jgi:hypothetical protein
MLISPKSWNDVRVRYEELGSKHGHDVRPMLRLLEWIQNEGLEAELFPHTSMFDLVISDRAESKSGENTLRVTVADSVEMLREFLTYKFGVYRKRKAPNQAAQTTPGLHPSVSDL